MSQMNQQYLEYTQRQPPLQVPKKCLPSQRMYIFTKANFDQIGVNIVDRQKRTFEEIRHRTSVAGNQNVKEDTMYEIERRRYNLPGASFAGHHFSTIPTRQQFTCSDSLSPISRGLQINSTNANGFTASSSSGVSASNVYPSLFSDPTHSREITSFEFETMDDSGKEIRFRRYYLAPKNYYKGNDAAKIEGELPIQHHNARISSVSLRDRMRLSKESRIKMPRAKGY